MHKVLKFNLEFRSFRKVGVSYPSNALLSFFSQCCVCNEQIVPPTVTVCKEDRKEMFFRRNIEIPSGSRCYNKHTIDKRLLPDVFLSMVPHRLDYRLLSPQHISNIIESYRTRINSKKHLDFGQYTSLTDANYDKLTGFTRAQHNQILSHIPSAVLKNSATRSARSALGYLLMKLKLGLSDSALASITDVDSKRQISRIISSARVALAHHFVSVYLGLSHITRQDIINKHTSPIVSRLLAESRDSCIFVLDGTYVYMQVSHTKYFKSTSHSLNFK